SRSLRRARRTPRRSRTFPSDRRRPSLCPSLTASNRVGAAHRAHGDAGATRLPRSFVHNLRGFKREANNAARHERPHCREETGKRRKSRTILVTMRAFVPRNVSKVWWLLATFVPSIAFAQYGT